MVKLWLVFVAVYFLLYIITFLIDVPYFNELLEASNNGRAINAPLGYKLLLVFTSPFNPLENFAYSDVLYGFFLNFVLGVAFFSLFSFAGVVATTSSHRNFKSRVVTYSIVLPFLSSYAYALTLFLLSGLIITGTSGFGVSTLMAPSLNSSARHRSLLYLSPLNVLLSSALILVVASTASSIGGQEDALLLVVSYLVLFVDMGTSLVVALANQRGVFRAILAVTAVTVGYLLAWFSYLRPGLEGSFVHHLITVLILFGVSPIFVRLVNM
ncbi:MAG: hypothetical protein ACP5HQ_06755 [Thermoprotei archaeon]